MFFPFSTRLARSCIAPAQQHGASAGVATSVGDNVRKRPIEIGIDEIGEVDVKNEAKFRVNIKSETERSEEVRRNAKSDPVTPFEAEGNNNQLGAEDEVSSYTNEIEATGFVRGESAELDAV